MYLEAFSKAIAYRNTDSCRLMY